MSDAAAPIVVRNLSKAFRVHEREEGLLATFGSLFARRFKDVVAVEDVSFEVAAVFAPAQLMVAGRRPRC